MQSPSIEVVSTEWSDSSDQNRARRLALLLFDGQSERVTGGDGGHDIEPAGDDE